MTHLEQLQKWTKDHHLDFTYLSNPKTIQYLTGYYNNPYERVMGLVVFPDDEPFMFAPDLQVEEIQKSTFNGPVYGYADAEDPWSKIAKHVEKRVSDPHHVGFEATNLVYSRVMALQGAFEHASFDHDVSELVKQMRMVKTPEEIKKLAGAGREADFCFKVGFHAVKVGATEDQISAEIKYALMKRGIMFNSFPTSVQAGAHASEPHNFTSENRVKNNELVLFDLGTVHDGYMSDSSRTVAVGHPDQKKLDIYKTVREAQQMAMDYAKPGVTAESIDKVARDHITKAGYGKYFLHRLGHGIGLSTHEFPTIRGGNKTIIKPGMCFSIEPGIYVPGVAGVRIEDCVHVTETGVEPFTHTPKHLIYVD